MTGRPLRASLLRAAPTIHWGAREPRGERRPSRRALFGVAAAAGTIAEIVGYLHDLYGIDVSPNLISTVTDAVLDEIATWQQRPLDPVYPLVFFDALGVKIRDEGMVRNKPVPSKVEGAIHIAPGVRTDGAKEVLGLWLEQNEGAKHVLSLSKGCST